MLGQSPPKSPPYDAWPMHYILAIDAALRFSLTRIKAKTPATILANATEDDITEWLQTELIEIGNEEVVEGYTHQVFQYPHLDSRTSQASGGRASLRPDLRFYKQASTCRVTMPLQDAWFCECKIIEENHSSRTYKNYWGKGIQRFVDGQYAGAMTHAQMLAYVRWPSSTHLGPKHDELKKLSLQLDGDVCITRHSRARAKTVTGQALSDIELRHLWFKFQ
jgi:hypothetical protein